MMPGNRPGSRRSLRGAAAAALAASLTLAAAGCTTAPHVTTGKALIRNSVMTFNLAPIRPGAQYGLLFAGLANKSRSPVVIKAVALTGQGVGTVIKLVEVKIAPHEPGNESTPGGTFEVYPPTGYWGRTGSCGKQVLDPVTGFRIAPGKEVRVWFRIQATKPGTFHVKGDVVLYRQNGITYRQFMPTGYKSSVSSDAPFLPIEDWQARCMKAEHARPLPGQYVTKPKNWD
jgi:hypothetical protein